DPYTSSLASAVNLLPSSSGYWTYLVDGGHVASVSYPAGSFLLQAPLVALGLNHLSTDWLDLAAWVATALILYRALPLAIRWLSPLLLLTGAFAGTFADGGTDALFLPFLVLAVWRWDRFVDAARPRAMRWLSPLALGVACSIKQSPWICVPFLLLGVAFEARAAGASAARAAARYGALTAAAFLTLNLPFIAWGPRAWWHGTLLPLFSPLVPDGQGLVTLALHGATRGVNLHELWLAAALVLVALVAVTALAYPAMKRVWLFLAPVVLFVPGRSFSSYLLDFFPVALAAAVTTRPAPPVSGWRLPPRVSAAAVGVPLVGAVAASGWALTSAPLSLSVSRVTTEARHQAIRSITLSVTNNTDRPASPHYMFTLDGGHPAGFWLVDAPGGSVRIAPHATATVTISPPGWFWAPQYQEYWLVTAYTSTPAGVSTTRPSQWGYRPPTSG
ncbi:MAG TPA: hypothetical protein VGS61_00840, partial [Acidimicrobiales bacterium]|nr:hypothetical protein [Acidimicrobiales bacterium]